MRLSAIQQLFARDIVRLLLFMESKEFSYTFGEALRSKEQAEIYAQQGKGIVNSLHCQKLAMDINLFDNKGTYLTDAKDYAQFGVYWESLTPCNRWGGNFHDKNGKVFADANHFERNERPSI
jgi:hypothetical protein